MPRKPKVHEDQQSIPTMEAMPRNDRVRRAAKRYVRERDARIAANAAEKAAHESLMEAMVEGGYDTGGYDDGSIQVFVDLSKKCKVDTTEKSSANGDGEE